MKRWLENLRRQAELLQGSDVRRLAVGPAGHAPDLSQNAAESISATAEGISDPNLRAALERLAAHAKPKEQR
jgi:hypothetical protein